MLYALIAVVAKTEPVQRTFWQIIQDAASLGVSLATLGTLVGWPLWKMWSKKRAAERTEEQNRRRTEVLEQIETAVAPLQQKVDQIHHTTTINGGKSNPPTLRDEVNHVGKQVQQAIQAIGAIAVNQSSLSARFDDHERDGEQFLNDAREALRQHGIELPDTPEIER